MEQDITKKDCVFLYVTVYKRSLDGPKLRSISQSSIKLSIKQTQLINLSR